MRKNLLLLLLLIFTLFEGCLIFLFPLVATAACQKCYWTYNIYDIDSASGGVTEGIFVM